MRIKNKILQIVSFFTDRFCERKKFEIPEGYNLVHDDNFDFIDFNYWTWYGGGYIKTNDLKVWWDSLQCVNVHDNILELDLKYNPRVWKMSEIHEYQRKELGYTEVEGNPRRRVFDLHNPPVNPTQNDVIEIPYVAGHLDSQKGYKYGIFKIDVMFPEGKKLWPSFWFCGIKSWPPEIDVFEGHTRIDSIEPNVHYGDCGENHRMTRATRPYVSNKQDEWHETVCWWEKDFIRIYYDGRLVYEVKDKNVLKWFDKEQRIILNLNIERWELPDFEYEPTKRTFKLKNFRIYQK